MFCDKCGTEMGENQSFCAKCGTEAKKEEAINVENPVQVQEFAPYAQPLPVLPVKKKNNIGIVSKIFGMLSGFISIMLGIIMFGQNTGVYEYSESYGGDAYTGIQNAAAQTANNLITLGSLIKNGVGFLLISIGLIAIFYFASKINSDK